MKPALVLSYRRTGVVALNVISAALDVDSRTAGTEVHFTRDPAAMVDAIRRVQGAGARAVCGWSFYSTDFDEAARDLELVKRAAPGALHVAGGVHATAEPRATLGAGFELVALGEGEATIIELFAALSEGRDPRNLRGIAHFDDDGGFVSHGPGERRPLDEFPAFNLRYGKCNALEITRGCVYACAFCQTPYVFKARFRHRSVENVREHVRAMARLGGNGYVRFVTPTSLSYGSDDTSVNLAAVEALLAAVREELGARRKIYFGTFPSEVRPEHVTPDALAVLRRYVDNRTLIIGGQSGSERVLEATRRGHDVAAIVRAVEVAVRAGFRPDVDFLFGMPGETLDDRRASLALAERLIRLGARIHNHTFLPLPGTPLRDAEPATLEPEITSAMLGMEGSGAVYGKWQAQMVAADRLVRARRESRAQASRKQRSLEDGAGNSVERDE